MKQYYYVNSAGQQAGPVAGESLKQYNVTEETLVWCEGMSNWAKAGNVEELKPIFVSTPPPPPSQPKYTEEPRNPYGPQSENTTMPERCPDSNLVWAILSTVFCCLPCGIPAIVYAAKVEKLWLSGDKAGAIKASQQAKTWSIISVAAYAVIIIAYASFVFFYAYLMNELL